MKCMVLMLLIAGLTAAEQPMTDTALIADLLRQRAPSLAVDLGQDPSLGSEGFRLSGNAQRWVIAGGDARGLLYGGGQLLRRLASGGEVVGSGRPAKPLRGVYLATHFGNWFHAAPVSEVEAYVDDLALRGANAIAVWFDLHHFAGWKDPAVAPMVERLRRILARARRLGLETSLVVLANEAWADSPVALRADWTAGHDGYVAEPLGHFHVELCPAKPGARELILRWRGEVLDAFRDPGIDRLIIWPYDQGGCTCAACAPWAAKGFLDLAEDIERLQRERTPRGRCTLSSWYAGRFHPVEWPALRSALASRGKAFADLLVDDVQLSDPAHPLRAGAPAGMPLIGFPEVTMWGNDWRVPWGGFGATPFPAELRERWRAHGAALDGGFIFTEGLFADLNTSLILRQWWDGDEAATGVSDELAMTVGAAAAPLVTDAVNLVERSLARERRYIDGTAVPDPDQPVDAARIRFAIRDPQAALRAEALLAQAEALLPASASSDWRWRCLRLRGRIDAALVAVDGAITQQIADWLGELTALYHAEGACWPVAPPTPAVLAHPLRL